MAIDNHQSGIRDISESREKFADYLNFAGRLFKLGTAELLSVYHQMPTATMIAPAAVWQKYGGHIIDDRAESLVVVDKSGKQKQFFDYSQTLQDKPRPFQWSLNKDIATEVLTAYNAEYNRAAGNMSRYIDGVLHDNVVENLNEYARIMGLGVGRGTADYKVFRKSVISIATRIVAARCELGSGWIYSGGDLDLSAFDLARENGTADKLAAIAEETAKAALRVIEKDVNKATALIVERSLQNGTEINERNTVGRTDDRGRSGGLDNSPAGQRAALLPDMDSRQGRQSPEARPGQRSVLRAGGRLQGDALAGRGRVDEAGAGAVREGLADVHGAESQRAGNGDSGTGTVENRRAESGARSVRNVRPFSGRLSEIISAAAEQELSGAAEVAGNNGFARQAGRDGTDSAAAEGELTGAYTVLIKREADNSITTELKKKDEKIAAEYED